MGVMHNTHLSSVFLSDEHSVFIRQTSSLIIWITAPQYKHLLQKKELIQIRKEDVSRHPVYIIYLSYTENVYY